MRRDDGPAGASPTPKVGLALATGAPEGAIYEIGALRAIDQALDGLDLDSAQSARFGEPGLDHVPISVAVQASSALPGLYSPVEIDGRHYIDGVLLKTLHASVALEAGAELVICVNPVVPVDTVHAVEAGLMRRGKLLDRGLPGVLSQTFRTVVRSRLEVGLAAYERKYADRDVVLLEPQRDDYKMC